jgi:hypothetical protein
VKFYYSVSNADPFAAAVSKLNLNVESTMLFLTPMRSTVPFTISRIVATTQRLAALNVGAFGLLSDRRAGDKLRCEYLTLETHCDRRDAAILDPTKKYKDPKLAKKKREGADGLVCAIIPIIKDYEKQDTLVCATTTDAIISNQLPTPQDTSNLPSPSSSSLWTNAITTRRVPSFETLAGSARFPVELPSPVKDRDQVSELQAIPARVTRAEMDSSPVYLKTRYG